MMAKILWLGILVFMTNGNGFFFSAESYDDYYDIKNIFTFKMMTLGPFHGGHHSGPG